MSVNKRGQAQVALDYFMAGIFTLFLLIILVIMVSAFKMKEVDVADIEAQTYVLKTYYNQEIFAPDTKPNFGVIDKDKFTQEHIDLNNHYLEDRVAARLTLIGLENDFEKAIIHNNKSFRARYPLAAQRVAGAGSAHLKNFTMPVRIYEQGAISQGLLHLEVLVIQ